MEDTLPTTIQLLKKITLAILAGSEPGKYSLTATPVVFEFIYGIGAEGLEPFEVVLADKCVGEHVALTLAADEVSQFFGRFLGQIRQLLGLYLLPPALSLQISVTAVVDADNREVVQALAKSTGHGGCGGSCDCGCSSG
jgi:hypothetical protein